MGISTAEFTLHNGEKMIVLKEAVIAVSGFYQDSRKSFLYFLSGEKQPVCNTVDECQNKLGWK